MALPYHSPLTWENPPEGRVCVPWSRPSGQAAAPALQASGLVSAAGDRRGLNGLDLDIAAGEFVAVVAPAGSGTSTLLRVLAGLDTAAAGQITIPGPAALAPADPRLVPWRRLWANVCRGVHRPAPAIAALAALDEVGLLDHAMARPLALSRADALRVSLARALVREPALLLLDEPFRSLDPLTRTAMHRLVLRLWARHRPAVLLGTTDVDEALTLADRVCVLRDGRIAASAPVGLPRPRRREDPRLAALRSRLLAGLGTAPALT